MKRPYLIARTMLIVCVVFVSILVFLVYRGAITKDDLAIWSAVTAIAAAVVGLFATRPLREDVREALPEIIRGIPEDTLKKLREAEIERTEIVSFLESRSNEIFLLKLRDYLEEQIIRRYQTSELPKLVADLQDVETELTKMSIAYGELQVPQRFRKVLDKLSERERFEYVRDYIDTIPFLGPFRSVFKASLKLYAHRNRLR
jgi:hypothetical protein